jgi:hypothetical protein
MTPGKAGKNPQQARKQPAYVTLARLALSEVVTAMMKPTRDNTREPRRK